MAQRNRGRGAKNGPQMEWHHGEDEAEWQSAQVSPPQPVAREASRPAYHWQWLFTRQYSWLVLAALIVLVAGAVVLWKQGEMGLAKIEEEIDSTIAAEAWLSPSQVKHETPLLDTLASPNERVAETELLDLNDDWAVVQVLVHSKGEDGQEGVAYRQRRVYEEGAGGWQRIQPTARHWGKPQEYQSRYFRFQYFEQDAAVVEGTAEQLDQLYSALYTAILSGSPKGEMLIVQVDPTHLERQLSRYFLLRKAFFITSPTATLAPLEISESEILQQAMALAFFEYLIRHAVEQYPLPAEWIPLRDGLRLWLIWEQELSLSRWRETLVHWSFEDSQSSSLTGEISVVDRPEFVDKQFSTLSEDLSLPDIAYALCDHHYLWMYSPADIGLPILCFPTDVHGRQALLWPTPYLPHEPLPLPPLLTLSLTDEWATQPGVYPSSIMTTIAMATTLEYISATYGRDQIPRLLAAVSKYKSWETLIPALFDIPQSEFEERWRAFLSARYGITR